MIRIYHCRFTGWRIGFNDARGYVTRGIRSRDARRMLRNLNGAQS